MFYLELTEIDDGSSSSCSSSSNRCNSSSYRRSIIIYHDIEVCYYMKLLCDSARGMMTIHQSIS